ncbi:cathelicidin-B1-like [Pelecanus crispus]|uniref:cathelicidin-B1-like n=1 Tax=Pelecanus crispus TaxID=36300 RepID=UPI003F5D2614
MRPCQALPLLLLLLGLARATTPAPNGSTPGSPGSGSPGSVSPSPTALWAVSYKDAVSAAVELLNARAVSPYVLRLWEAHDQPSWTGDLQQRQELSFTVEETTCRAPGMATAACRSHWFRVLNWCRGFVFLEEQQPMVELCCKTTSGPLVRSHPSKLRDIFARIKERFKALFQRSRIWIRDKLNLKNPEA